jgi:two-component system nitrate/nitrite response regulator NarL
LKRGEVAPGSALTARELEVLLFLGKGFSNAEIGRLLGLTKYTVNDHVQRIFRRLDVDSRVEAAVWAAKQGLL